MFCNQCGTPNSDAARFCSKCGAQLPAAQWPGYSADHPQLSDIGAPNLAAKSLSQKMSNGNLTAILLLVTGSVIFTFIRFGLTPNTLGFFTAMLAGPFLVAYALYGARKRRNWNGFAWVFFGVFVAFYLFSFGRVTSHLSPAELVRQITGQEPISSDLLGKDRECVLAGRSLFEQMVKDNQDFKNEMQALNGGVSLINKPESLVSRDQIDEVLRTLSALSLIADKREHLLAGVRERFRAGVDQTSLSDSDKRSFVDAAEASFRNTETYKAESELIDIEKRWIQATREVYEFAANHQSEIVLEGGQIESSDAGLREQFSGLAESANNLSSQFLAAIDKYDQAANAARRNLGLTPATPEQN